MYIYIVLKTVNTFLENKIGKKEQKAMVAAPGIN